MPFPSIVAATRMQEQVSAVTSAPVLYPAAGVNGHLLVAAVHSAAAGSHTWDGSWTVHLNAGVAGGQVSIASKTLSGGESAGGTAISVTIASSKWWGWAFQVKEWTAIETSASFATGTSTTATPADFSPSGGAIERMMLAAFFADGESAFTTMQSFCGLVASGSSGTAGSTATNCHGMIYARPRQAEATYSGWSAGIAASSLWAAAHITIEGDVSHERSKFALPSASGSTQSGTWVGGANGTRGSVIDDYPECLNFTPATTLTASAAGAIVDIPLSTYQDNPARTVPAGAENIAVTVKWHAHGGITYRTRITGGTTVGETADKTDMVAGTFELVEDTFLTNPSRGSAWQPDDVNGIGSHALAAIGWNIINGNSSTLTILSAEVFVTWDVASGPPFPRRAPHQAIRPAPHQLEVPRFHVVQ